MKYSQFLTLFSYQMWDIIKGIVLTCSYDLYYKYVLKENFYFGAYSKKILP